MMAQPIRGQSERLNQTETLRPLFRAAMRPTSFGAVIQPAEEKRKGDPTRNP